MKEELNTFSCRVCLRYEYDSKEAMKYLSLFESCSYKEDLLTIIADKISSIANIEIKQGDGFPDRICPACLLELENAIDFKRKCENSDSILRNTAQRSVDDENLLILVKDEKLEVEIDNSEPVEDYYSEAESKPEIPINSTENTVNYPTVQCDDCGGVFKSKCKLRVHWKAIHKPEKLVCPKCKRMFKSYKAFNIHTKKPPISCIAASQGHIEVQGKSRTYHCKECPYKTLRPKDFYSHLVTHTGERKFKCTKCPKSFTQQSSLQGHLEGVHNDYLLETTCQVCGKWVKGRNKFYRHMMGHKDVTVQCQVCKKVLKNRNGWRHHMQRHGTKTFHCEICGMSYYSLAELDNHKSRKHLRKKYSCDICGFTLLTAMRMKMHIKKHTGTSIACGKCGVFFEDELKWTLHQKRHNERNYPCKYCDKTFYTSKSRSRHVTSKHSCLKVCDQVGTEVQRVSNLSIAINEEGKPNIKQENSADHKFKEDAT